MLTLGTQRDLTNDMLIKGIIDSIVTVNQFYAMLPFKGIQGNALAYNRELAGVDQTTLVDVLRTGVTGINKDVQKFERVSTELTTIIGDAQVNGLIQAVGSDYNDATAVQVAAKAKGVGRRYMDLLINGNEAAAVGTTNNLVALADGNLIASATASSIVLSITDFVAVINAAELRNGGTATDLSTFAKRSAATVGVSVDGVAYVTLTDGSATEEAVTANGAAAYNAALRVVHGNLGFDGLKALAASVTLGTGTEGSDRLDSLDLLIDSVLDKDGMVDYMMMNSAGVRKITAAFRSVGTGFDMMDVKTSSGAVMSVQSYRGVPIFRNDFISGGSEIYVGTLDDGSMTHGICGLTALNSAGMQVQKLGAREDVDADITRVKWYCGLAHFSELGLFTGTLA